jgi:hypothetical protein
VAPKIVPFSTVALLQRGERVTITCTMAKGDVPLNIAWLKDGAPVAGDDVKVLTFDHFNSMLTIESLDLRHVGNYTCQAANQAGTASHSQAVLVNGNHRRGKKRDFRSFRICILDLSGFGLAFLIFRNL